MLCFQTGNLSMLARAGSCLCLGVWALFHLGMQDLSSYPTLPDVFLAAVVPETRWEACQSPGGAHEWGQLLLWLIACLKVAERTGCRGGGWGTRRGELSAEEGMETPGCSVCI